MRCKDHKVKTFNFTKFLQTLLEKNVLAANLSLVFFSSLILLLITQGLSSFLSSIDEGVGSLTWTLSPDISSEERLTIVAIDEKSLNAIGPWPWSRDQMAQLASSIDAAGAQIQIHDVV